VDDARKALADAIAKIDWTQTRTATLKFERGALPFSVPVPKLASLRRKPEPAESVERAEAPNREPLENEPAARSAMIEGVASSTSVDCYGTDMSMQALRSMAEQFTRGIPYLPRHNYGIFGASVEWDEVIGRTVLGEVVPCGPDDVMEPYDRSEPQAKLAVTTRMYGDEPKAGALLRRVDRGEPIGQSVGGWFIELAITSDEEGYVKRVQVLDVELDHLAVTRAPANPDSAEIVSLRSVSGMVRSALDARRVTEPAPAAAPAVDNESAAAYALGVQGSKESDARGSALPENLGADLGTATPENAMPEQITPDVLRQIVTEAVAPLAQRIAALEGRAATPSPVSPAPVQAPVDPVDWKARAEAAERSLADVARGERVGRSMPIALPQGPQTRTVFEELIERTRAEAPRLAVVAKSIAPTLADEQGADPKISQRALVANLGAMLNAAEADGVITNPFARAAWR
jgi:hypothetical protein